MPSVASGGVLEGFQSGWVLEGFQFQWHRGIGGRWNFYDLPFEVRNDFIFKKRHAILPCIVWGGSGQKMAQNSNSSGVIYLCIFWIAIYDNLTHSHFGAELTLVRASAIAKRPWHKNFAPRFLGLRWVFWANSFFRTLGVIFPMMAMVGRP